MGKTMFVFTLLLAVATAAVAAAPAPYSPEAFDAARRRGGTVVVSVHADWCPTCRAQSAILRELAATGKTSEAVYLIVDFDGDKKAVKRFTATYQSTLVVFHGGEEVGRSIGETDADAIRSLVERER